MSKIEEDFFGSACYTSGEAPLEALCDQMTRAIYLMRQAWSSIQMKQDEQGAKRSADGVGESKHTGRWSGRARGEAEQVTQPPPGAGSSLLTGLGQRRLPQLRRALGRLGLW
jgi:hypothetical protein